MSTAEPDERVRLVPYDPAWPQQFAAESEVIRGLIGPWITGGIHHVGSTAVPGLAAKPVIDIQVGVADLVSARPCIEALVPAHYVWAPYRPDVMLWFCKPGFAHRTHHLHLVPTASPRFADVLAFRDLLRANPDEAADYLALKRRLAEVHAQDREAYTDGKSEFVAGAVARAHEWRARQPG